MKVRVLKLFRPDEEGGGQAPPPTPAPVVVPAPPQELTQPVIDHAAKIAAIEAQQARHEEEFGRQLGEVESRLNESMNARLNALEEAAARAARAAEEAAAAPPEEVATLAEGAVEVPRVKTEKPRGIHGRRKARRNK